MGLSASQARFLQLTARRGDIEYEVQQINFQRLQLSEKLGAASTKYNDAMSNRTLVYSYNNGQEVKEVDLSYTNYKNYMNQQLKGQEGVHFTDNPYYLVSSSGNKIVVASEEERNEMIQSHTTEIDIEDIKAAKKLYDETEDKTTLTADTISLAQIDLTNCTFRDGVDEEGNEVTYYVEQKYTENDFIVDETLTDVSAFQNAIRNGTYFFAQTAVLPETGEEVFKTEHWDTIGGSAIRDALDKTDDAEAEAEYERIQTKIHSQDRKLELKLDQLETNRQAIQTEIESVEKVIEENIEKSFNVFS